MRRTGFPICASTVARLTEVVVFPSRANDEVMTMTFGDDADASSSDVRNPRYDSEIGERGSRCGSRSMPRSTAGISAGAPAFALLWPTAGFVALMGLRLARPW